MNTLQSIIQKVHKNYHQLVGDVNSLVPLATADHMLARQMPRRCCDMFSYSCVTITIYALTDTLPSVYASLTTAMVHGICTYDTYSTLAFCTCDFITDQSIASWQENF